MANALQAVLDKAAGARPPEAEPRRAAKTAAAPATATARPAPERKSAAAAAERKPTAPAAAEAAQRRPVREGKRFVGAHVEPEVARQLKVIAAEDDTTIQDLLEEALDLLFAKKGKATLAALARRPG